MKLAFSVVQYKYREKERGCVFSIPYRSLSSSYASYLRPEKACDESDLLFDNSAEEEMVSEFFDRKK
jgi:hypothetical protein